ncbi:MAG: trigger factor [Patescibacteria group bacterium]
MTSTNKKLDADHVELTVELGRDELAESVRLTEDALNQEVVIDGFRPGKTPRERVRQQVGEARVLESALQTAIQRSLAQIITEQKLDVVETTDLAVKENTPAKLIYSVKLQIFPEVQLPDLASIKVSRCNVVVEPKEIDEALETVKTSRAVLTGTDGSAVKGDRLEIDFEVKENGILIDGGQSENHPVVIGKENFVPGFENQLVGLKKGDRKEFSLMVPKDFANKTVAGKKLDFVITVKDIKKVTLPELTDDFAKTLGKFENLDQLMLNIRDGLTEEKKEKETQRVRLEIMDALINRATCVASPAMIEDQLTTMMQNFDQDLHRHDLELSLYLAKIGKTQEDIKKEWRSEAERQVKMALILHALARENNIEITREETDQALESLVQSTMLRSPGTNPNFDMERMRSSIQSRLLSEKTLQFLEKTCVVTL